MVAADEGSYSLRAVDRVCNILDALADSAELSLQELTTAARLPKSSAFRYLSVLEARHYVSRTGKGTYGLGVAFRPQHRRQEEQLVELALPLLSDLRIELEETVNLGILDGSQVVHAAVVESPHMMRLAARVGERGYVHSTALGKAICATLTDDRVRSILMAKGMPQVTDHTITDPDAYLAELELTRAQGFGLDEAENQAAGRCVGVYIPHLSRPAGVSVSAPADRLPVERVPAVAAKLHRVAREISQRMQLTREGGPDDTRA